MLIFGSSMNKCNIALTKWYKETRTLMSGYTEDMKKSHAETAERPVKEAQHLHWGPNLPSVLVGWTGPDGRQGVGEHLSSNDAASSPPSASIHLSKQFCVKWTFWEIQPNKDSCTEEEELRNRTSTVPPLRPLVPSTESFDFAQHRLLTADHSNVFCMWAVVFPNSGPLAVQQRSLLALTLDVIQEDLDASVRLPKRCPLQHC